MKLIYLANINIFAGWAHEIQIMKMCEVFAQEKVEVELVIPRRWSNLKEDPFQHHNIKKIFKITRLPCLDLAPGRPGHVNFWLRVLSFLFFAKVYLVFKKYDFLYTREQLAGFFFKNINLEIHVLPERIENWHKKVWTRAKTLIVLTSFIKKELIENGIKEEKILISGDGVDINDFDIRVSKEEARKHLNLPPNKKLIVYTGSFYLRNWKGVDILLNSAKYFSDDYLFVLVGGNENEIEQIKNNFKINNILLTGRKPHAEIPYYLKAADVLVLPNKKGESISEKYTSPLKLFEYMASGRPIVASSLPSIREILNENNAVLVEPNNPESLALGIKKILQNGDLSAKISKQALQNVQNYTWEKRADNILDFVANA